MSELPLYMDYAATTPVSPAVMEAMNPFFTQYFGNPSSKGHAYGWMAEDAIKEARQSICRVFSCLDHEIIFTSGATESINLALKSFQSSLVVCPATEHKATIDLVKKLKEKGRPTKITPVNTHGQQQWDSITKVCTAQPSLLSILAVNNETGIVTNLDKLQILKKTSDCLIHIDATQAVGKFPMQPYYDVADLISFSGHKIFGPKGIGVLICKNTQLLHPQIIGGGQQRNLRSGTLNVPGIIGIGVAVSALKPNATQRISLIQDYFETQVTTKFPFCKVNAAAATRSPYISNICFKGFDGELLMERMHKVAISNGSACNSAFNKPSHVLKAMSLSDQDAFASLRFSFSPFTSKEDIDFCISHIDEVMDSLS